MAKQKKIDLLYGELYAHCEHGGNKFYGFPLRPHEKLSGHYEFLTRDGVQIGEAELCTRIWEKNLLNEYRDLKNEAQRK